MSSSGEALAALLADRFLWAVVINGAIAALSYWKKLVDPSGVVVGLLVGLVIYLFAGPHGFAILFGFFLFGSVVSKFGYRRKEEQGVAQEQGGARGAKHALANCGVGVGLAPLIALSVVGAVTLPSPVLWAGFVAAFATALSDTVGSELGQLYGKTPILLTSFKRVPIGTEGAVSLEGTLLGIAASLILAVGAYAGGLLGGVGGIIAVVVGAFVGTTAESILGATIEERLPFGNEGMNFLNTVIGGGAGIALAIALTPAT